MSDMTAWSEPATENMTLWSGTVTENSLILESYDWHCSITERWAGQASSSRPSGATPSSMYRDRFIHTTEGSFADKLLDWHHIIPERTIDENDSTNCEYTSDQFLAVKWHYTTIDVSVLIHTTEGFFTTIDLSQQIHITEEFFADKLCYIIIDIAESKGSIKKMNTSMPLTDMLKLTEMLKMEADHQKAKPECRMNIDQTER